MLAESIRAAIRARRWEQVEFLVTRPEGEQYPVVGVRGEVDVSSAPALQQRLGELFSGGAGKVVVDLTDVGFIDSSGLGALVSARNAAEESGGALSLVCTSERILKLLMITGLDGVFDVHASVPDALASLGGGPAGD